MRVHTTRTGIAHYCFMSFDTADLANSSPGKVHKDVQGPLVAVKQRVEPVEVDVLPVRGVGQLVAQGGGVEANLKGSLEVPGGQGGCMWLHVWVKVTVSGFE